MFSGIFGRLLEKAHLLENKPNKVIEIPFPSVRVPSSLIEPEKLRR